MSISHKESSSFPPTWPVYTPALKLADWLESYILSLDLNVWTSSTVVSAAQDSSSKKWTVQVLVEGGEKRQFVVDHLVFATGIGGNIPNMPTYPGMVCVILRAWLYEIYTSWDVVGGIQWSNLAFQST
jgi:cation diffusion facilitator CzcD-associated flavoprotein CzcO